MNKTEINGPVGQLVQAKNATLVVNLAKFSDINGLILQVGDVQIIFKKTYRTP